MASSFFKCYSDAFISSGDAALVVVSDEAGSMVFFDFDFIFRLNFILRHLSYILESIKFKKTNLNLSLI